MKTTSARKAPAKARKAAPRKTVRQASIIDRLFRILPFTEEDIQRALTWALLTIGLLIAGAMVFNYVVAKEEIPKDVQTWLAGFQLSKDGFLLLVNITLLILGCLLEGGTILLVIVPIFIPAAQALGIDMVHFGLVVTINLMIGLITPPYGLLLFIVASMSKQPLGPLIKETLPWVFVLIAALMVMTYVPESVLWLPKLLGYKG